MREENTNLKKLIIDASFLLSFLFPDEGNKNLENSIDLNSYSCITSPLLDFEILNALQSSVRRKRISEKARKELEILFFQVPIERIELKRSDFYHISDLASKTQLTIYDSSYLYLAFREKAILASFDNELLKEARKRNISVWLV